MSPEIKKLYLSDTDKKLGGVCGGIAEYYEKDSTLFRVLFVLITIASYGAGLLAYFAMWLVIPKRPKGGIS